MEAMVEIDGLPIKNGGSFHGYVTNNHGIFRDIHGISMDIQGYTGNISMGYVCNRKPHHFPTFPKVSHRESNPGDNDEVPCQRGTSHLGILLGMGRRTRRNA
jgi:hypothetical protein